MKPIIFFAALLLPFLASAQDDELDIKNYRSTLYLTVKNSAGTVQPNLELMVKEKTSGKAMNSITDSKGKADFEVVRGAVYILGFKNKPYHSEISIPSGGSGFMTKTITFDAPLSAEAGKTDSIRQNIPKDQRATATEALVKIIVTDKREKGLPNIPVSLYCMKTNKIYISQSDQTGEARFLVFNNNEYQVNVDAEQNYAQVNIPDKAYIGMSKKVMYTPTSLNETVSGDTIRQQLTPDAEATNSRVFIKMLITNLDRNPLVDEPVFIEELNGNKVFTGVSGADGIVNLLIPKGQKYLLSFKYERNVDLLDLVQKEGYRTIDIEYGYMGSQKIEEFYKTAKRDKNGFITEFMQSKINPAVFEGTVERTADGYNINHTSSSSTSTPATYDGMLLTHGGYYSRNFYSFDEKTGKYNWGLEFAESGPSSAVVEDSVLLINTQSCTLYALEAYSGKLLWSKWLGPDLYSTPSVANGKVYAVYPNELGARVNRLTRTAKGEEDKNLKNVIACFDLKTGKIIWQNWLDSEVLSSPVVSGSNVYLTCLSGKLYEFDKNNGNQLGSINDVAVSPPTVVNDKVYVSVKVKNNETVAVYNTNGLKPVKKITELSSPLIVDDMYKLSSEEQMNFCGTRMLNYKGRNYNVMGNRLICSTTDGSVLWSMELKDEKPEEKKPLATMPVAAGDKIVISTLSGNILAFDPASGKELNKWSTGHKTENQATINKGWIYSGTEDGKIVSINTGESRFTGWNMFGFDGSHNTVVR